MVKVNFDTIPDQDDFAPLPIGEYLCEVFEVKEAETKNDDPMWKITYKIIQDGVHYGRYIWDNLIFSDNEKARQRYKLALGRIGLNTEKKGEQDLEPGMIDGKKVWITVGLKPYEDRREDSNGKLKMKNDVPFAGYRKCAENDPDTVFGDQQETSSEGKGDEDLPF